MNAMPYVKIWWDDNVQAYHISTPYNEGFVTALKQAVPLADRVWNKESKIWTITERAFEPVKKLIDLFYKNATVSVVTKDQARSANVPKSVSVTSVDVVCAEFVKMVGFDAMQKAYRHAAFVHHPDRGGNMETMSRVNALWSKLQEDLWQKKSSN